MIRSYVILISMVIISLFSGCIKALPEGGYRPRFNMYYLGPFDNDYPDSLKQDAVYLNKSVRFNQRTQKEESRYSFIRLFPTGHALQNILVQKTPPTVIDFDNFEKCVVGYYRIKGDQIIIEVFTPMGSGRFTQHHGSIRGESIIFKEWRPTLEYSLHEREEYQEIEYSRYKGVETLREADW